MRTVMLAGADDFDGWRNAVRAAIADNVPPELMVWQVAGGEDDLFAPLAAAPVTPAAPTPVSGQVTLKLPGSVITLARTAILHSDGERFALLHQLVAGVANRTIAANDPTNPVIARLNGLARSVRRDIHKMRAFVRFRSVETPDGGTRFVAWFEPDHHIVRANAKFFVDRFATMNWSILTPATSIHWDTVTLTEGPGATRGDAPDGDPVEDAWKRYYASIFNPARLKIGAMMKEMPKKYWANMPETALIAELVAGAQARSSAMIAASANAPADTAPGPIPPAIVPTAAAAVRPTEAAGRPQGVGNSADAVHALQALRDAANRCMRCPLYAPATQIVFGEGPADAALMLVGEQPGDNEDSAGRPFIGPAGQLLDEMLAEAGIDRRQIYLTNAVKHFKHEQRGKRRIHQTPVAGEVDACRWWLDEERAVIRPRLIVALGATAARALFGRAMPVGKSRGQTFTLGDGTDARITTHPSYLLRIPDADTAMLERRAMIDDLRSANAIINNIK